MEDISVSNSLLYEFVTPNEMYFAVERVAKAFKATPKVTYCDKTPVVQLARSNYFDLSICPTHSRWDEEFEEDSFVIKGVIGEVCDFHQGVLLSHDLNNKFEQKVYLTEGRKVGNPSPYCLVIERPLQLEGGVSFENIKRIIHKFARCQYDATKALSRQASSVH
ncbi:MAG: hypothetical protein CMF12_12335 [Idiomarina sp.]|uniref:hypothetical protein n=1 Tax=Idiomarina sp. TaxID=1874361 RepID=UPI000C57BB24|nr:hypothetical protein [Idiomarina sp.]MBT43303.1 hypothetical protein [Idiomarina sp.]